MIRLETPHAPRSPRARAAAARLGLLLALAVAPGGAASTPCDLDPEGRAWVDRFLALWQRSCRELLGREDAPVPEVVLFDAVCAHRLAASSTAPGRIGPDEAQELAAGAGALRSDAHHGTVALPGGGSVAAEPAAFASVAGDAARRQPYLVVALPALWRQRQPGAATPALDGFLLGVALHELTHTLQLPAMERRVEQLRRVEALPERIHDTVLDGRFADFPEFVAARERERVAWLSAARAEDAETRRALTRSALAQADARRHRFLGRGAWSEIEELFVGLEGAAVWIHFEAARRYGVPFFPERPELATRAQLLSHLASRGAGEWVQDVGLPLVLLLDELRPGWQSEAFGERPFHPLALLRDTLTR